MVRFFTIQILEEWIKIVCGDRDKLLVYPNPTSGNSSIDLDTDFDAIVVSLTDLNGKLVYNNTYKHTQQINLELNEPAGTYLLTIEMEGKRAVIRLVKR